MKKKMILIFGVLIAVLSLSFGGIAMAEQKIIINTDKAPVPIGTSSQAVKANGLLFLSGQLPIDPVSGKVVEGGIVEQTRRVMNNLQAVLAQAGLSFADVVKCNVYLRDMSDFGAMNQVYSGYFSSLPPAVALEGMSSLPQDALIEIELVASYNGKNPITLATTNKSFMPLSPAVKADGLLFLSGQLPIDPATGDMVTGDISAQTKQTMKNAADILKAGGLQIGDVIKSNAYLGEFKDMAGFNKAYAQHFKQDYPTRCVAEAGPLPYGVGMTLEMVATYSDKAVVNPTPGKSTNPNPLSPAIRTNKFLFLSGQIPRDLFTGKVEIGAIEAQTAQSMKSLQATLAADGLTFADVAKTTIYLTNMDDYEAINNVYSQYFPSNPPALTVIGVSKMNSAVSVEIEMVAVSK